jgi:hypothetical protein
VIEQEDCQRRARELIASANKYGVDQRHHASDLEHVMTRGIEWGCELSSADFRHLPHTILVDRVSERASLP